jgi:hypothetical protein
VPRSRGFDLVIGFALFVEFDQCQKLKIKNKNDRLKSKSEEAQMTKLK